MAEQIARSHRNDPSPSIQAAAKMNREGRAKRNRDRVVEAVAENPGSTSGELERAIPDLDLAEVRRRLSDASRPDRSGIVRIVRGVARKCRVLMTSQSTWRLATRCERCGDWVASCDACPCERSR